MKLPIIVLFMGTFLGTNASFAMENPLTEPPIQETKKQEIPVGARPLGRQGSFPMPGKDYPYLGRYTSCEGKSSQIVDLETILSLRDVHRQVTGKGIRVGVYEDGVDSDHPDIENSYYHEPGSIKPNYLVSHGTAVSSMITKVAPESKVTVVPVFAQNV